MAITGIKVLRGTYNLNALPVRVASNMLPVGDVTEVPNCILGACDANGTAILTPFQWTRKNNDVWEVKADGFYVNGTRVLASRNTRVFFVLQQISDTQMAVRRYTPLLDGMGYINGRNNGGYYFQTKLSGWGNSIQTNYVTGSHTIQFYPNNDGGSTGYYPGTGHICDTQYTFTLMNGESYTPQPQGYNSDGQPTGGTGENYFEGDDIAMPGEPDETISGALANGFLNVYAPSAAQLSAFGGVLWTNAFNTKWYDFDSTANLILNAVSNPIDYIVGLFMIPVTPQTGGSSGIFLGGINADTVTAPKVTKQFKTVNFGTLNIEELYGNYLDYSNSHLSIYLPYVGTADLDVQEVNGGSVELQYTIDCFTGACVANVKCTKTVKTPWGLSYTNSTVHSYSGNVAIQLPISAGSFDTMLNGLVNVGLGLGTNTPAIAMQGGKDVMQGFSGDVTTRGSLSSNTGKLGYQTPYLMFTRPIESRPANLGALHGYSAGVGGTLSQFTGYIECSEVKLDGVTATDSELNEIESILKSGVYV